MSTEKITRKLTAPFRWLKQGFINMQFKLAGFFLGKKLKKQANEPDVMSSQGVDGLKTMVMEFARKSYTGMSKDKKLIITMNGQFKVEDIKIDPELVANPKLLKKAMKQAIGDIMQKILGAMMGLAGGGAPSIPGFPGF